MPDCDFDKATLTCPVCHFVSPVGELRRNCPEAPPCNAGDELHRLLARLGIKPTPGCPCNDHLAEMNRWGCDKCRREVATIVGWMREEAERRGLPFSELAAKLLVLKAIRAAERASKAL